MAKLEQSLYRLFGGEDGLFGNGMLIIIVLVLLFMCTDILDIFLEDDNMWIWIILVILLVFNFDDTCY
ncbi:hypothetical protein [Romboutsia sp.]|uniref:hypothetical protein n=1 Tax=Romboutsia sp. TaxID=1965302 RepID=UPI003F2C49EF